MIMVLLVLKLFVSSRPLKLEGVQCIYVLLFHEGQAENHFAMFFYRDFYFRALGSSVVLSFPQPLSFSSVLPKPLSETLTRSSDGRNPV
jgi:hypothetical protein